MVFCGHRAAIDDKIIKRSLSTSLSTDFLSFNVCLMLYLNSCLYGTIPTVASFRILAKWLTQGIH